MLPIKGCASSYASNGEQMGNVDDFCPIKQLGENIVSQARKHHKQLG